MRTCPSPQIRRRQARPARHRARGRGRRDAGRHGASAQAATLFSDNFNDGNADGWSKSGGSWSVVSDASPVYQQSSTGSDAKAQAGSSWGNQTVQARVRPQAFTAGSNRFVGIIGRAQNMTNYYYLALTSSQVVLGRRLAGNYATLASAPASVSTGTWYTLRFEASGSTLRGYLNGAAGGQRHRRQPSAPAGSV